MMQKRKIVAVAALLLVVFFTGSVLALRGVERVRGKEATLEEVLYLPSSRTLKKLSLGYSALLADIYWTRAVQYFGAKHLRHSTRYDLLYPLLDITTDLDPHLLVAYQDGAMFLSQQPPGGAGQPDKAIALLQKGIRENPSYWRLYFTLGFVHYIDRDDPRAAQQAFEKGSEVPGALPWMKVMAARMAERSKDVGTTIALWTAILENTTDKDIRHTAESHLDSVRADLEINELERRINIFHQREGTWPQTWADLERAGLLRGVPVDPSGTPYELRIGGDVEPKDPSKYPYLGEWRYNQTRPF